MALLQADPEQTLSRLGVSWTTLAVMPQRCHTSSLSSMVQGSFNWQGLELPDFVHVAAGPEDGVWFKR